MADPLESLVCDCRKRLSSAFEVDARVTIPLNGVTVLFGPSGSGKTTLLRLLAGLEAPDSGTITFRGRPWQNLSPQNRRAGFLFQDYALFPHLTVAQNIAYAGPRKTAAGLMEAFGLAEFADRLPGAISGGQQQRTALARALAAGPELLLLDEPLSALDAPTRIRMRYELRRLLLAGGVPSIVVTHDRMEAVALGDWMAVMVAGQIRQAGLVREVFRKPADRQVAESVGVENVLPVEITGRDAGLSDAAGRAMPDCSAWIPARAGRSMPASMPRMLRLHVKAPRRPASRAHATGWRAGCAVYWWRARWRALSWIADFHWWRW